MIDSGLWSLIVVGQFGGQDGVGGDTDEREEEARGVCCVFCVAVVVC